MLISGIKIFVKNVLTGVLIQKSFAITVMLCFITSLTILFQPIFPGIVAAADMSALTVKPDDIVGRWERFGDGAEGTVVAVKKAGKVYQSTLEKVTGTLLGLSFKKGELKWKGLAWTKDNTYNGYDFFKFDYGDSEYRKCKININKDDILEISVKDTGQGNVLIGKKQTWRRIPSAWAEADVKEAIVFDLTTPRVLKNYTSDITREEFAEISVKLYEKLAQKKAGPASGNPFKDTENAEVLKAFNLKIIFGAESDVFAPDKPATREQISVMLLRAIRAFKPDYIAETEGVPAFVDEKNISPWALDAVRHLYKIGIVAGTGGGKINPKGNTTREQAIVMIIRLYKNKPLDLKIQ